MQKFLLQWVLLNGITDNVINWLMRSNLSRLIKPKFTLSYLVYIEATLLIIISRFVSALK